MVWSQDSQTVFLRVTITSVRNITHGQVFVGPGADCPGAGGVFVSGRRSLHSTPDFNSQSVWEGWPIIFKKPCSVNCVDVDSYEIELVDCRQEGHIWCNLHLVRPHHHPPPLLLFDVQIYSRFKMNFKVEIIVNRFLKYKVRNYFINIPLCCFALCPAWPASLRPFPTWLEILCCCQV